MRLQLRDTKDGDGIALRFGNNATSYEAPYLLREELVDASRALAPLDRCIPADATKTKAATTSLSTAAAESACRKWLQGIMRASPNARTRSSDDLIKEAQKKFPGLSARGYYRARIAAAEAECAPAWLKGGAPKKPPQ